MKKYLAILIAVHTLMLTDVGELCCLMGRMCYCILLSTITPLTSSASNLIVSVETEPNHKILQKIIKKNPVSQRLFKKNAPQKYCIAIG